MADRPERPTKQSRFVSEISQMLFVFGEVKNPDEDTVKFIEEIVRIQVGELVLQARHLAQKRNARNPNVDDLIFLIRSDKVKVNRLRTYLSWRDVRKKAKEDGDEKDVEAFQEDVAGTGVDNAKFKAQKLKIKLAWDPTTVYGDVIPEDENQEEEDEDDREAYEASEKRLREADELTRQMTREEYAHYSECRQASFTYRKAKRFREFVGIANFLDTTPKDDFIDVLGFLSYEIVRSLCERGLAVKREIQAAKAARQDASSSSHGPLDATSNVSHKRSREDTESSEKSGKSGKSGTAGSGHSPTKRRRQRALESEDEDDGSAAFKRPIPGGLFTAPPRFGPSQSASTCNTPACAGGKTVFGNGGSGVEDAKQGHKKEVEREPLTPSEVEDAYSAMQSTRAKMKTSAMRNFSGGLWRSRITLI